MKIIKNLYILIFIVIIFFSCDQLSEPEQKAVKMSREELAKTIGFTWFNVYIDDYTPNDSLAHIIDSLFDRNNHKLIFFLEPECTCKELVKDPAYLVNILDHANITENNYEFWGMGTPNADNPYKEIIQIKDLPHIAFINSGNYVYSILDSFYKYKVYKKWILENVIIDALEKNK